MSFEKIDVAILLVCKTYKTQFTVKCVKVSVTVSMNSLKNNRMASVIILAIVSFLICEKVINAMSERIKFLLSLKHLSLFFFISSKEGSRRFAREVKRGEVV
jgi:uncharacterized membrane protein YobD (UPF0266 family)